ncbi:MAG: hypothetical protein M1817_005412 [Caeruleum heppii]|nr:MAG: hypothetical protein M1817_005412 [Caeruleum heppii]
MAFSTPPLPLPPIRACLFDMDGLLLDSEDIYTLCTNIILHEHGRPDLPWSVKAQLQGRPGPERSPKDPQAGAIFHAWAGLPLSEAEFRTRQTALQREHFPSTRPLPGVEILLRTLTGKPSNSSPSVHIALATSSHSANYTLKTAHLTSLFTLFPSPQIVLGDDPRIPPGRGKPAPDIYLLALRTINEGIRARNEQRESDGGEEDEKEREILPEECLVFEDSVPGVEAGRRAGMRVIWVPHPGLLEEYKDRQAEVLAGRTGEMVDPVGDDTKEKIEVDHVVRSVDEDIPSKAKKSGKPVEGKPGEMGDGWAERLDSLEGFPYERYGIAVGIDG